MWTMTKIGFFSAVQHRDNPDDVLVRARSKRDLENLVEFADLHTDVVKAFGRIVASLHGADYPFRLTVSKVAWATVMGAMIGDIDYDNFKTAVGKTSPERAHTYGRVWHDLLAVEREATAGVYGPETLQTPSARWDKATKKVVAKKGTNR